MQLVNIHSHKRVYEFPLLEEYLRRHDLSLGGPITQSPIPDIVGLAASPGRVLLWNLKTDNLVMALRTIQETTSLSFSTDTRGALKNYSILATGLADGKVLFWDLNTQSILSTINLRSTLFKESDIQDEQLSLEVGFCSFVESGVLVTAGDINFIGFFIFEESDIYQPPRLLRFRKGHSTAPHFLRFY